MQMSELRALLTPAGLQMLEEVGPIRTSDDALRAVSTLRAAGHDPELVSAVTTQARLRTRAVAKFGEFASQLLFTQAGLEQATRMPVAALHAARMRNAQISSVADLGCGIGADALAFAAAGLEVLAVDADEVTAALASYNLAPFAPQARAQFAQAQDIDLAGFDAAWFDPARRTSGHSETARVGASAYSPPLDWVFSQAEHTALGVKLGPGHDRDALPEDAETQWISADGSVVETLVWTGKLAREGVRRSAVVLKDGVHHEITAAGDAADVEERELGTFLHEPDGAVIRARLIGDVARALDAGMVSDSIAYLTGDAALTSPFVQSFRVREVLPNDIKHLAKALRARNLGTLEIKKRGVDTDPAVLRKKLQLKGPESATLILTRRGNTRLSILADRV